MPAAQCRQIGGLGVEGEVPDLVEDDQWRSFKLAQVSLQTLIMAAGCKPHHRLGRRGEEDSVAGQASLHSQRNRQMGLAGAGRPKEDHVLPALHEGQGRQRALAGCPGVEHRLPPHAALPAPR